MEARKVVAVSGGHGQSARPAVLVSEWEPEAGIWWSLRDCGEPAGRTGAVLTGCAGLRLRQSPHNDGPEGDAEGEDQDRYRLGQGREVEEKVRLKAQY